MRWGGSGAGADALSGAPAHSERDTGPRTPAQIPSPSPCSCSCSCGGASRTTLVIGPRVRHPRNSYSARPSTVPASTADGARGNSGVLQRPHDEAAEAPATVGRRSLDLVEDGGAPRAGQSDLTTGSERTVLRHHEHPRDPAPRPSAHLVLGATAAFVRSGVDIRKPSSARRQPGAAHEATVCGVKQILSQVPGMVTVSVSLRTSDPQHRVSTCRVTWPLSPTSMVKPQGSDTGGAAPRETLQPLPPMNVRLRRPLRIPP
ncbi:hypothetical protein SMICM304S_08660 [Streptomyces microflavus]